MARKILNVTISAEGRDQGKVFVLTEKSARGAEEWGARAMLALLNSGIEVPDEIANKGMAGVAALGIKALSSMSYEAAKPLLDDMLTCIQFQPSPTVTRRLIEDDIEEVSTLIHLRKELINMHLGFFTRADRSTSGQAEGTKGD